MRSSAGDQGHDEGVEIGLPVHGAPLPERWLLQRSCPLYRMAAPDGCRRSESTSAAIAPPMAPNRWPCHEMPGLAGQHAPRRITAVQRNRIGGPRRI